jgi:sugar O-acyltransferase (sialic acid O-acetyltransferase NeuD family)
MRNGANGQGRLGLVVGAGGHGQVVAAIWRRAEPEWEIAFLDDNPALWGTEVAGLRILGGLMRATDLDPDVARVHVAIGANATRLRVAERLADVLPFAPVIDPSAVVMPGAAIGTGTLLGPRAVVQTAACVGKHVILNTGAIVEHDCVIENGATVGPGARMAGRVHIGRLAFVATGATLVGRVRIGACAIVGAGAVVTRDVPPGSLAFGVPARVVRQATPRDWERLL